MSQLSRDEHLQAMRAMAWERAKGELRGIAHASYSSDDPLRAERMEAFMQELDRFVETVEDNGLIE